MALAAALALVAIAATSAPASAEILVASGDVTATSAVLWARVPAAGPVTFEVAVAGGPPRPPQRVEATGEADFTARAVFDGLAPATRHVFRVRHAGDVASGELTTAPDPGQAARVTFLWSGDLGGGGYCRSTEDGYGIFRAMTREAADFFLFVGDTIYADVPCNRPGTVPGAAFRASTLAQYRARHRYNREDPAMQEFLRRTPVYATWDDHDVRNNFAGPTEPLMPVGRRAFLEYWPVASTAEEPTRLYRRARWGRLLEVFVLDTRQYRSPNTERDGPGKTMLGAAQRRWLIESVAGSTATWKVIVTSVPLSVPTGRVERRDSWTGATIFGLPPERPSGFAHERDDILRALHQRGVRNLVVVAGDVHHAEVIRHEPEPAFVLHELIAGPLSASHGRPRPLDDTLNPLSLFGTGGLNTYGAITVDATGLTVRLCDEQGATLFTHTIAPQVDAPPRADGRPR